MIFNKNLYFVFLFCLSAIFAGCTFVVNAQSINIDASRLVTHAEVYFSPRSGSFVEGSTFEVPIILNTKGNSINGIEVRINFDKNKLSIIKPSSGTSIISVWVEPPKYDNTKGAASYVGVIPDGIVTTRGLIGTITFKALATGRASISIENSSKLLQNDGLGTEVPFDGARAEYSIIPKAPEGLNIFSDTHPFQSEWYNNNNAIISWESEETVNGFSYELDNKPKTIPDNVIDTEDTTINYEGLTDGLWYFHIKANKKGVCGNTGDFLVRIDTSPPAEFKPEVNYLAASAILVDRALVSFFTTDNLSGVDHYEVGVIDKNQPFTESPVFIESQSPFQIPVANHGDLKVIVRALDKASNVRDVSIDLKSPSFITDFIKDYLVYILTAIILISLLGFIIHYILVHHIFKYLKTTWNKMQKDENRNKHSNK
jgi:hypothetical protein